jgi:hypothetical protein
MNGRDENAIWHPKARGVKKFCCHQYYSGGVLEGSCLAPLTRAEGWGRHDPSPRCDVPTKKPVLDLRRSFPA